MRIDFCNKKILPPSNLTCFFFTLALLFAIVDGQPLCGEINLTKLPTLSMRSATQQQWDCRCLTSIIRNSFTKPWFKIQHCVCRLQTPICTYLAACNKHIQITELFQWLCDWIREKKKRKNYLFHSSMVDRSVYQDGIIITMGHMQMRLVCFYFYFAKKQKKTLYLFSAVCST